MDRQSSYFLAWWLCSIMGWWSGCCLWLLCSCCDVVLLVWLWLFRFSYLYALNAVLENGASIFTSNEPCPWPFQSKTHSARPVSIKTSSKLLSTLMWFLSSWLGTADYKCKQARSSSPGSEKTTIPSWSSQCSAKSTIIGGSIIYEGSYSSAMAVWR